ncbi:unnamed protein product [Haemonchus placei]|uniref:TFIIIC_sub6 domain-containing protein n=1 Tax=Haemonchus placei TaxID=6290 RepID=A0A0N4X9F1_HAEPC|nr:unnamed protein product [Haemonchus placei]
MLQESEVFREIELGVFLQFRYKAGLMANSLEIHILDETRYESVLGTDPSTQLPYMQGSVEITRQEVEIGSSHLEDFACQCYASGASDSHVVRSDPAHVRIACGSILRVQGLKKWVEISVDEQTVRTGFCKF